ncbi:SGNH/GDSL hydrolase family protein [Oceanicoccus sagamiensis]|uniref:SGNH hydrolase-type esterase domain-containing protein n=1 Tax=Oceanicoccus sagamiensis TaxID=716816 RepID=A0A1X9ND23_9GAMM|nr:SGNH/GDSL hydrolase family protein [Oceanicoccus sagamiensis]ARN74312.1 hypothetical protein BST96_09360 [Oceanicoccus sagamiensis]
MTQDKANKQSLLAITTVTISLIICAVLADTFLGWYKHKVASSSQMQPGLMRYHPQLGWTLSPSWQGSHQHHDFSVVYSTHIFGFRNGMDEQAFLPHKKTRPRVALVGDSFTFGFGVNDEETFHAQLSLADPDREYINLSVPGYSTDQQYLLIKNTATDFAIDHYVLVFYLGNDILDNPLPFPLQAPRGKPFFELHNNQLQLNNTPVPKQAKTAALQATTLDSIIFGNELAAYSSSLDYLRQSSELLRLIIPPSKTPDSAAIYSILERRLAAQETLLLALLKAIQQQTQHQQSALTLAILPGQSLIVSPNSYSAHFQDYVRIKSTGMAETLGIEVIDIAEQLAAQYQPGKRWFHPNEGHLTAEGHRKVAEIINSAMQQ